MEVWGYAHYSEWPKVADAVIDADLVRQRWESRMAHRQCGNEVASAVSWSKMDQQEQPKEP